LLLANHGEKMERSRLKECTGMRYTDLDPILAELAREGRIKRFGEMITLLK
jgi:predicted Rossmann fold nucleotide-binding protein DprA/Smf involved in DNA uptake